MSPYEYYINKNVSAKPGALLTICTDWHCNLILPFEKRTSSYIHFNIS